MEASGTRPDARVEAAYRDLQEQTDQLFAWITNPDNPARIRVLFTDGDLPYADDRQLVEGVRARRELEVTSAHTDRGRQHPMLGCERGGPYDRFRAVHDILGHAWLGAGFDRDGEFTTWVAQERQYGGLARWALATELHGEHSVYWTTGEPTEHKGILLQPELLARARRAGRAPEPVDEK
jgi:hypothetical protein